MSALTYQIGVSRPQLPVMDLPTPEEVVGAPRITGRVLVSAIIGPSLIALGVSIGSGEWLLGPFNFATYGFVGICWIILVSAVLQVFYNVELARFTVATGEVPQSPSGGSHPGSCCGCRSRSCSSTWHSSGAAGRPARATARSR